MNRICRRFAYTATTDARRLAAGLCHRYEIVGDDLLLFFSGSKGFYIGLPLSLCGSPEPSLTFQTTCRRLAESIGVVLNAAIDSGLSPSEVRRQIECGLNHRASG